MPCYRCGVRQTDPEHGPSPWKRGVVGEHQVLVCPACQSRHEWAAEFQSCARCGSLHLIRRLDQVECLDCRLVRDASPSAARPQGPQAGTFHSPRRLPAPFVASSARFSAPGFSAPGGR
jgi:hypothetical protein